MKGVTTAFLIVFMLGNLFYMIAATIDGQSYNVWGVGPFFWGYVAPEFALWIITAALYWAYVSQIYDDGKGGATVLYPRFTWDSNTFFFGSLALIIFTFIPFAIFYHNVGFSFSPDYSGGGVSNVDNLEFYFIHQLMAITSFLNVLLSLWFLYIFCVDDAFSLANLETIRERMSSDSTYFTKEHQLGPGKGRPMNAFYPGTARPRRSTGHRD